MHREQVHLLVDTLLDLGQSLLKRHAVPPEAKVHLMAARREVLLGARAMIDAAISRTAEKPAEGPRSIPIDD